MKRQTWVLGCSAAAIIAAGGVAAINAVGAPAKAQTAAVGACSVEAIQSSAPADTTIVSAQRLATPVGHCRVEGYVTTTNPGPNRVNFRLQLPDKPLWKGRYYFIGLGGSAGYVPTESQIPGGNPMLMGFATAGTDTGRQGHMLDWSFLRDPVKRLDHTHRAAHVTAVATQQITRAFYGVSKIWRYHSGCSGGGRMGGEAISHHPEDFDGVLLGQSRVTDEALTGSGMYKFMHAAQQMTREPGAWVSPSKLKMVEGKVMAACDATDGAVDGVIWDHRLCHYDVAALKCQAGDGPDCLTQPEITSIKAILDGPRGGHGERLSYPMPISNMSVWSGFIGPTPPPWSPAATSENLPKSSAGYVIAQTHGEVLFGPSFDALKFDLKDPRNIAAWEAAAKVNGFFGVPDLIRFQATGGKALLWVGVSDPCCSNLAMEGYVKGLEKAQGPARVAEYIRLYEIPGAGHCGGGNGPGDGADQLLRALIAWVEQGKTPGPVEMHRGADRLKLAFASAGLPAESGVKIPGPEGGSRDFLVCPYPQVSVFDKSKAKAPGAVWDAANWSCRPSRT